MARRHDGAKTTATPLNNLPLQTTSFIGRAEQIQEVRQLVASTRLLTLVGAGGCGKTRLALEVAADVLDAFRDGVWFIDLAALTDAALVPQAVAQTLGIRDTSGQPVMDVLQESLRTRRTLLILDNCEHLIDAAARVADGLLRACPEVQVLATSREPLRSPGETTWRVPSLRLPPPAGIGVASVADLVAFESVKLFVERAQAALPGFAVTPLNTSAVQEICRRLDGIPLAIELAAARVRVLSIEQLAARLDDRLRLLTAGARTAMPRQQTLQATVEWSHALLSEPESTAFRRLSVFAGGWTLDAAEMVTCHPVEVLAALVEKSLVVAEQHPAGMRYRLLETIRQYARERLRDAGETEPTRDRHLDYVLQLVQGAEATFQGPEARLSMELLQPEIDNLRGALDWALRTRPEVALALSAALGWFWWGRDYHTEGRRWIRRSLAATAQPTAARMKALHVAGWLAHHQRDLVEARDLLRQSLALAEAAGDNATVAWVLQCLGRVAYFDQHPEAARSLGKQSLAIAEQVGDQGLVAWAHHLLGLAAYIARDYASAREHYTRSLAIRRQLGFQEGLGILTILLGLVAVRENKFGEATALYQEGLSLVRDVLGPWGVAMPLAALSHIAASQGEAAQAVRLGAVATQLVERHQTPLIPLMEPLLADGLARARKELGEERFAQAHAEGQRLSLEAAIADALALQFHELPSAHGRFGTLTPTELQVLRLLARGHTSKEIAAELVIGVSTVDRHLTHIYTKLGARNRAEATAVGLQRGMVNTSG